MIVGIKAALNPGRRNRWVGIPVVPVPWSLIELAASGECCLGMSWLLEGVSRSFFGPSLIYGHEGKCCGPGAGAGFGVRWVLRFY